MGTGRFGQDREDFAGEAVPVGQLLIEAPGANTVKRNLDHFVRRGRIETLSRAGAAIALFTLQTYAPSGGAGHRCVGPRRRALTTLLIPGPMRGIDPTRPVPLWHTLWLATQTAGRAPLRASFHARPDSHLRESSRDDPFRRRSAPSLLGLPRRIRLVFEDNGEGRLAISPAASTRSSSERTGRGRTVRATSGSRHPLSPHYRAKPGEPFLPLHGQPGRVGYTALGWARGRRFL